MSTALKLSVAEYDAMVAKGAFDSLTQKIELIHGEIKAMNPAGPIHDHVIEHLNHWSVQNTEFDKIRVRIQSGLSLPQQDSRPEPDVLWVRADHPRDRHPVSEDVLLLIEVADSSLQSDRQEKAELYAKAGIVDYWVVNLADELIHVYRQPGQHGYELLTTIRTGHSVSPLVQPDAMIDPAELFGQ
jgi:Uma2 family endonuclease